MEIDSTLVKNLLGGCITMIGGALGANGLPSTICILIGFGIILYNPTKKKVVKWIGRMKHW